MPVPSRPDADLPELPPGVYTFDVSLDRVRFVCVLSTGERWVAEGPAWLATAALVSERMERWTETAEGWIRRRSLRIVRTEEPPLGASA